MRPVNPPPPPEDVGGLYPMYEQVDREWRFWFIVMAIGILTAVVAFNYAL